MKVEYKWSQPLLAELLEALGWQGGTIHQAIAEVCRRSGALRQIASIGNVKHLTSIAGWRVAEQMRDIAIGAIGNDRVADSGSGIETDEAKVLQVFSRFLDRYSISNLAVKPLSAALFEVYEIGCNKHRAGLIESLARAHDWIAQEWLHAAEDPTQLDRDQIVFELNAVIVAVRGEK